MRFPKSPNPPTHPAWHIWPVCPAVSAVTWGQSVIKAKDAASKHLQMSFTLWTLWKWACSSFALFFHLSRSWESKTTQKRFLNVCVCVCVAACSLVMTFPKMTPFKPRFLGMYVWTGAWLFALQILIDLSLYWFSISCSYFWHKRYTNCVFVPSIWIR